MTTLTGSQTTLAQLRQRRDAVTQANRDLAHAIAAHIAALVRETFPAAVAVVIDFPNRRSADWTAVLDSVVGPAPSPTATLPVLFDNTGDDAYRHNEPPAEDPWWDTIATIESLAGEYAELIGTLDWPWCDTDGRWRILNFPPAPASAVPEKAQAGA